jgi:arsenate reductase
MVFVWSYLTDGDPAYTLVQVSLNDLLMLLLFAPLVSFLVTGASDLTVPFEVLLTSVLVFIVVPLALGGLARRALLRARGRGQQLLRAGGGDGDRALRAGVRGGARERGRRAGGGAGDAHGVRVLQPHPALVPGRGRRAMRPRRVLFACVHNAGRSQMAAALLNRLADPARAEGISAGTQPDARVHPEVVEAMRELGVDVATARPQLLTDALAESADLLVTMGCGEACPHVPGLRREDWALADPKGQPLPVVRAIRDEIRRRVEALVRNEGWQRG